MPAKSFIRILVSATLLSVLALSIATPALAFDGRGGETVTIPGNEVVHDDLYVTGQTVVVDGTIEGDLVVFAKTITVNGTVEGDLIAAGQDVIVNGTIQDDARIAGAALFLGENAVIGGDVISAGASLEARPGNSIGQDVVFAGGQALLAGDVARNLTAATGGLELRGTIGGNVKANVGNPDQNRAGPGSYMANSKVSIPNVKPGLTIDPAAKIAGNLEYTSTKQFDIPEGVVAGKITYTEPKADKNTAKPRTPVELALNAGLNIVRNMITLILLGLLLAWLFPGFIKNSTERIKNAPFPALGGGILSVAAFCFSLLVLVVSVIIGAVLFGKLTLGGLSALIIASGLLAIFVLILGFVMAISFVAQIIVGTLGGQLILARIRPELAEHKYWPLMVGMVIFALLAAVPFIGWAINLITVLLGLGALWYFGHERLNKKPAAM